MSHVNNAAGASPWLAATQVSPGPSAIWTRRCDKLLELLVAHNFDRWQTIVSRLVGGTSEQAFQRYKRTVDEVKHVLHVPEVETPREWDMQLEEVAATPPAGTAAMEMSAAAADVTVTSAGEEAAAVTEKASEPTSSTADAKTSVCRAGKRKKREENRKKPEKWTVEEHSLFLEGLKKYGTGKWKAMSSEFLTTKSASQIVSHHQKHCKRWEQRERNGCKRSSIHDITEPTSAAAAVVTDGGGEPAAQEDRRGSGVESNSPGEFVGADEEFPDDKYGF